MVTTTQPLVHIMTTDGVEDVYVTEKSVNGEKFMDFIETTLLPILLPFTGENEKSVVIMDNAVIHHLLLRLLTVSVL